MVRLLQGLKTTGGAGIAKLNLTKLISTKILKATTLDQLHAMFCHSTESRLTYFVFMIHCGSTKNFIRI